MRLTLSKKPNTTDVRDRFDGTVHTLFTVQVQARADAVAVVHEGRVLTCRDLDETLAPLNSRKTLLLL